MDRKMAADLDRHLTTEPEEEEPEPSGTQRAYMENPRGHTWLLDEDGFPDIFGFEVDPYEGTPHNGMLCTTCGAIFCHHCLPGGPDRACGGP